MEQRAVLQVKRNLPVAQTNLAQLDVPGDWTLTGLRIESDKVSIGAASVFDVNKNGVTLFTDQTTRPRILAGASEVEADSLSFDVLKGDKLSVDLDSVPASGIGENLQVTLTFEDGESVGGPFTLADITDAGTAAALDVPASGNAAADQVVKGNDTRLTDARTPTAHTHTAAAITDFDAAVDARVEATGGGFDPDSILTENGEVLVDDATGNVLIEG